MAERDARQTGRAAAPERQRDALKRLERMIGNLVRVVPDSGRLAARLEVLQAELP